MIGVGSPPCESSRCTSPGPGAPAQRGGRCTSAAVAVRRRRLIFTPQLPHLRNTSIVPSVHYGPVASSPFALAAGPRPAAMFGRAASFTSSHSDADAWTGVPCEQLCSGRPTLVRAKGGCQSLWAAGRMQMRGRGLQGRGEPAGGPSQALPPLPRRLATPSCRPKRWRAA